MASSLTIESIDAAYGAVRVLEDVSLDVDAGRDRGAARHQRQRQEHADEMHHGHGAAERRPHRRRDRRRDPRPRRPHHRGDRRSRHRAGAGGPAAVSRARRSRRTCCSAPSAEGARAIKRNLEFCFEIFPRLAERRSQLAGSMSGGEQQMLALARALMLAPRILLVDEPSVGPGAGAGQPHHRQDQGAQGALPAHRADGRAELHRRPSASPTAATSSCTARSPSRAARPTSSTTTT